MDGRQGGGGRSAPGRAGSAGGEATLQEVLGRYDREGFGGQFGTRPSGRVMCFSCHAESEATATKVHAMHRFEGVSDPGEEMVAVALICPRCAAKGTVVLVYGPGSPAEDAMVLKALKDRRGASGIHPGV